MHWSQRVRDQQNAAQAQPTAHRRAIAPTAPRPVKPRAQRPKPERDPQADELLRLCREGRLYEIQDWIAAGKPLTVPTHYRNTPLRLGFETGFHSLLELLLKHHPDQAAKNELLFLACYQRKLGVLDLLLRCGADPRSIPYLDVLQAWDRTAAMMLLERGADPITDLPFARAFKMRIRTALGCFLDCKRVRPELSDQLQEQADMALRQACRDRELKWVSLLLWIGANPRSKGPSTEDLDDQHTIGNPELQETALEVACLYGDLKIIKRLKIDPAHDDVTALLKSASFMGKAETLGYLIKLGANPNDKDNGGSSALDSSLRYLGYEDSLYRHDRVAPASSLPKSRATFKMLLEKGAVWRPDQRCIADARRTFYRVDSEILVEFIELLKNHHACDEAVLQELLRTPKMQMLLRSYERRRAARERPVSQHRGQVASQRLQSPTTKTPAHQEPPPPPPLPPSYGSYDRKVLYDEVWAEPTQKVAKKYGVSDVAIAKACRNLKVPKPPRGYWAKKAVGAKLPGRPPLSDF